jgi:hypothetical protein
MQHEERGLRLRSPAGQRERAGWVQHSGTAARAGAAGRLRGGNPSRRCCSQHMHKTAWETLTLCMWRQVRGCRSS